MATQLNDLKINEVSLVDNPANSEIVNGIKQRRAVIALYKRDGGDDGDELMKAVDGQTQGGQTFPRSDYAYTPDDTPSHWKLRLTSTPGGKPDPGIVGAAIAALGKGFRGNKVQLPSSAIPGVKAKVRAAWRKANPDKSPDEMPEVIRKGDRAVMTMTEIEKKIEEQDGVLALMKADNALLKTENELVLKMTKKERKLYATMPEDKRKEFLAADDDKKKVMLEACEKEQKEKAAKDCMDEAFKKRYESAGPTERALMMEDLIRKADDDKDKKEKKGKKAKPTDNEENLSDDEDDDDDEDTEKREFKRQLSVTQDRVAKAELELAVITKRERLTMFTKRAEDELPHTPGNPIEKGSTLMTLADSLPGGENGEAFKKVFSQFKAADASLKNNFVEIGKHGGPIPAEAAFNAQVEEIAKRDKIDKPHAIEKALRECPELYLEYEHGQRQRVASY